MDTGSAARGLRQRNTTPPQPAGISQWPCSSRTKRADCLRKRFKEFKRCSSDMVRLHQGHTSERSVRGAASDYPCGEFGSPGLGGRSARKRASSSAYSSVAAVFSFARLVVCHTTDLG